MSVIRFWKKQLGHKLLTELTRADVIQGRDALKGKAPGTVHKYLTLLTHALNVAVKEYEWLDRNVASLVSRPPLPPGRTRFLSDEERARLLAACRESKNRFLYPLVVLALYTSLRRGSLLRIQKQDIDLEKRTLYIPLTKNKTSLVLPLVGDAYEIIKDLCSQKTDKEYIFPGTDTRGRWGSYDTAFRYAVKRANIGDGFVFHSLRHTAASIMAQQGIPLFTIGAVLNHKNLAMTARYSHLQIENLKGALEVLAQRLEG